MEKTIPRIKFSNPSIFVIDTIFERQREPTKKGFLNKTLTFKPEILKWIPISFKNMIIRGNKLFLL